MAELVSVDPRWVGRDCIIAAPGPSLAACVLKVRMARMAYSWKVIAVQDAYKLLPYADVLYGCDSRWWRLHKNCDGFNGEKWTCHHKEWTNNKIDPDPELKVPLPDLVGLKVVEGRRGDDFSLDPSYIYYGSNSGFQALNLAILFGSKRIVLVGYDMRCVDGKSHFFGDHKSKDFHQCSDQEYRNFARHYDIAARTLPKDIHIVNATPGSALTCFPIMPLEDALGFLGSPPG
jgi:hypothetical protein